MTQRHTWTREEDRKGFQIYSRYPRITRRGLINQYSPWLNRHGITSGSMMAKIKNFQYLDTGRGLSHCSNQCMDIYNQYQNLYRLIQYHIEQLRYHREQHIYYREQLNIHSL